MPYSTLNSANIIKTLRRLNARIGERFPDRGLAAVAGEVVDVAEHHQSRAADSAKPWMVVRVGVGTIIAAGAAAAIWGLVSTHLLDNGAAALMANGADAPGIGAFEAIEAAVNLVLLSAAGIFFLTTTEERLKRRTILNDLHELRSLAHVIDMHQLTKDPTSILKRGDRTKSSPDRDMTEFQLTRYLDYCAEMLALIGKLAALYAQNMRDPVVIQAVNEIEDLTAGLSSKIWQKILIMQGFGRAEAKAAPATPSADDASETAETVPHPAPQPAPGSA